MQDLHVSVYRCVTLKKRKRKEKAELLPMLSCLHRPHKLTHSPFLLPMAACPTSWDGSPSVLLTVQPCPPISKQNSVLVSAY